MKTRITELLNIDYPIFQGGMAWVADGDLAGAVSKAGGLGIIGGGNAPKEVVKANIDKIKSLTDKPFGVNIMLLSPFVEDIVDLVIEEGVKVVTTGAGNPSKYMTRFHDAGITVIPVVPSVALAKRMEKIGADAVIAEGMEAGGHIGKLTTMTLVRQVAAAVSIPVIAAGGIADGEGVLLLVPKVYTNVLPIAILIRYKRNPRRETSQEDDFLINLNALNTEVSISHQHCFHLRLAISKSNRLL